MLRDALIVWMHVWGSVIFFRLCTELVPDAPRWRRLISASSWPILVPVAFAIVALAHTARGMRELGRRNAARTARRIIEEATRG